MPFYITKLGLPHNAGIGSVYYEGGDLWTVDAAKRKIYATKALAEAQIANPDGKNGGFNGAVPVLN
tara:strand:+ start:765 stop:962 length:198 start_codon:yes stop_codon:yes gene_type:complete